MKIPSLFLTSALVLSTLSLNAQAHQREHHRDHHYHGRPVYSQPEVSYYRHHHGHHRQPRYYEPEVQYRNNWVAPVSAGIVISAPIVGLPVLSSPRYTSGDPRYISYPVPAAPPRSHNLYCRYPDGFYPAIRHCPGGWERVSNYR